MPLRWASCLFRPARGTASCLEFNPSACSAELQEELSARGTACLRPRGAQILYERVDDAGQGAFTPPVLVYIKRFAFCNGLEVCIKRTLITHFVGRAAREARLQVQLEHPHLLPAIASIRGRHHYYLVLPAAEGDLWAEAEALRQHGSGYSEDDLRSIARQILLGLEHLHASHLAHRDVKPANLLRLTDGRVVVADFGCADACTAGFVAAGTTQFQPPECRRQSRTQMAVLPKGYDQRAQDLWGVGATLACLWFARMPEVVRPPPAGGGAVSRGRGGAGAGVAAGAGAASTAGSRPNSVGNIPALQARPPSTCVEDEDSALVGAAAGTAPCAPGEGGGELGGGSGAQQQCGLPLPLPLPAVGQQQEDSGAGGCRGLPKFLAAAGFAACSSTVGACGLPMSPDLLDLLSGLLRPRAGDRLTAVQALQHPWLTSAAAQAGARAGTAPPATAAAVAAAAPSPPRQSCGAAIAATAATPSPQAAAAAAAAASGAATAVPQLSPLKRLRASGDGTSHFVPFLSHHQLAVRHHRSSAPGDQPPTAPQEPPSCHHHHHNDSHNHQYRLQDGYAQARRQSGTLGRAGGASEDSCSHSHDDSSCGPDVEQDVQGLGFEGPHQRRSLGTGRCMDAPGRGRPGAGMDVGVDSAQGPTGTGGQLEVSPSREVSPSPPHPEYSSLSTWDSQPSPQEVTEALKPGSRRAILRVFVGAGGEASGSG